MLCPEFTFSVTFLGHVLSIFSTLPTAFASKLIRRTWRFAEMRWQKTAALSRRVRELPNSSVRHPPDLRVEQFHRYPPLIRREARRVIGAVVENYSPVPPVSPSSIFNHSAGSSIQIIRGRLRPNALAKTMTFGRNIAIV